MIPSRGGIRRFFAPGTAAAGRRAGPEVCWPDIDELAATLGRLRRDAGVVAGEVVAGAPADVVETEASTRPRNARCGPRRLQGVGVLDPTCGSGPPVPTPPGESSTTPRCATSALGRQADITGSLVHGIDVHVVAVEIRAHRNLVLCGRWAPALWVHDKKVGDFAVGGIGRALIDRLLG